MTLRTVEARTTAFSIPSREGLPIRGVVETPKDPRGLVILIHGFKGFREWGFFPWLAQQLVGHRQAVCRFDFSRNGVGESGDEFDELDLFLDDTYSRQLDDLECVTEYVTSRVDLAHLPISLLGHSRGGAIALLGAGKVSGLTSVVTWSAIGELRRWDEATIAEWRRRGYMEFPNTRTGQIMRVSTAILDDLDRNSERLNLAQAVSDLRVPLLVVHGSGDESVPVTEASTIAGSAANVSTLIVHQASHTYGAIHPLVHVPDDLRVATRVSHSFINCR